MTTITPLLQSTTPRADKDLLYSTLLAVAGLSCAGESEDVTPSDTDDLAHPSNKGLMVAADGNLALVFASAAENSDPVIRVVKAGVHYPWNVRRVAATNTTATGISIFFDRQ